MTVATRNSPLQSKNVMHIAERAKHSLFRLEGGGSTLWNWAGDLWEWYSGEWQVRDDTWLEDQCILGLKDSYVQSPDGAISPLKPSVEMCLDVARVLKALTIMPQTNMPAWLGTGPCPLDLTKTVAFRDVLVEVGGAEIRTAPRDERYFGNVVIPTNWEPEAACPVWLRTLNDWSGGEAAWETLAQRIMGYAMVPWRGLERGALIYGKIRGGKSTYSKVVKKLVGPGYFGTSANGLARDFGMSGVQRARTLWINEMCRLDGVQGDRLASIWKGLVGRDPMQIERKHRDQQHSQMLNVFPVMVANQPPTLPDKGNGISGKLLVLPFDRSFLGQENFALMDQLEGELAGIAAWAVKGAHELLAEPNPSLKWPEPASAEEVRRLYRLEGNPLDAFLEARFVKDVEGFVSGDTLRRELREWLAATGLSVSFSMTHLPVKLEQESSWHLRRGRNSRDERGVIGLALRREAVDEL